MSRLHVAVVALVLAACAPKVVGLKSATGPKPAESSSPTPQAIAEPPLAPEPSSAPVTITAPSHPSLEVARVEAADLLRLSDGRVARLLGVEVIDKVAESAFDFTKRMAEGLEVRLYQDHVKQDDDGTLLAYVELPGGLELNEELIRRGYASAGQRRHYTHENRHRNLERDARAGQVGAWEPAHPAPTPRPQPTQRPQPTPRPTPPASLTPSPSPSSGPTVWITETGEKYHTGGCRFLDHSRRAVPLATARQTYEPCKVCRPPR